MFDLVPPDLEKRTDAPRLQWECMAMLAWQIGQHLRLYSCDAWSQVRVAGKGRNLSIGDGVTKTRGKRPSVLGRGTGAGIRNIWAGIAEGGLKPQART